MPSTGTSIIDQGQLCLSRSSKAPWSRARFSTGSALAGTIDPEVVDRLVSEHQSGRQDHKRILYCLLELSQWHREFVERPG